MKTAPKNPLIRRKTRIYCASNTQEGYLIMTERNVKEMFKMMDTCLSAIDEFRTEVRLDLNTIKTDVAQLKTDVAQLKTDVAQLKTDVAVLKESQERFELELRRNNRALDKVAGHWMRTDIQLGKLEDAVSFTER